MKITLGKHFFNALMVDITNWTLNFTMVAFLYSVNKTYAVAIVCLVIMRYIAEFIFQRGMQKEMIAERDAILTQMQKLEGIVKQADNQQEFEFGTVTPIKPKPTDDKVH